MGVDFFTNDRYRVLDCMQKRQIDISGSLCVPLSQRQIAEMTGIAYKTVNDIMKLLKTNGYIIRQGTNRGQYFLTRKATETLSKMQSEEVSL
jgi:CRP-like cAMP-binding protein